MRMRIDAGVATAAALLASACAVLFLKLWDADLRVPLSHYSSDGTLNLMLVKGAMENTWFYENPDLGAPNKQLLYDYPVLSGDSLHALLFRLGGLFTDDPALVLNLFFLSTFPLTAVISYLVLRRLPVGPDVALATALLYTLVPYHFLRGETHIFLAAYYAVPVGAYLALSVLEGRGRVGLGVAGLAALVALASGSFYYSAFTVLLVGVAAVLRFLATREGRALANGGFVVAVIFALSLVQLAPTIVHRSKHGTNEEVSQRYWFESETYGLKLTQLLLPVDGHRLDGLAERKAEYREQIPQNEGAAATLGVVGSVGFLWLLGVALAAVVGAGRSRDLRPHRSMAVLTVVAVLVGTTGGLSTLIAVVWPQIRAWNRLSIFIAFFALAAVALLLESLRRRIPTAAFPILLAGILVLGAADQTTGAFVSPYALVKAQYRANELWFRSLESRLPEKAAVVQVPYEPFPEPPLGLRDPYESAKAYIHSSDLRWTWGSMRGRPEDWAARYATKPAAELVPAAREADFAAILVDRLAYPDQGAAVESELRATLGAEPRRSRDDRFLFWLL